MVHFVGWATSLNPDT